MLLKNKMIFGVAERKDSTKLDLVFDVAIYILFFVFAVLSFRYQYLLLNYREWGDESETIVAAKMMAAGMKLYSEIFNHHGPLTFLPGVLAEKFGDFGVLGHRVSVALLQVLAILSIYKSPALRFESQRILASVACATVILVFMPDIFGHMYKYQTIVGILLVVILSQYTIPAILCPEKVSSLRAVLGSLLIASLPFLAITYLPIAGLLFIASCRRDYFKGVAIGSSLGLTANLIFLGVYGSFAGFLAFHLYLNAKVLPFYAGLQPGGALIVNAVTVATSDLAHFLSLIAMLLSALILAQKEEKFPWRTFLLVAGLCSLLMRGAGFHGMPFFYAILPLLALNLSLIDTNSLASKQVALGFLLLCMVKISLILPGDKQKITSAPIPTETEFSKLVAEFTVPEDRIIAYSFQNFEYLASGRLPASGHFFYLPWQEKYNENPKFGISIDACKQIREAAPKVMLVDKWKVWDRFPWDSYAGCIQKLLDSNYRQVPNRPYYIRNDLLRGLDDYFSIENRKMIPSLPLSEVSSIKLKIDKDLMEAGRNRKLIALEIMFGTYVRVNPGVAQLILEREGGEKVNIDFALPELQDNHYKRFTIPEDSYVAGEVKWLTGGGISAWESHDEKDRVLTCMKYVFSDGSRGFTPGCPMF
ncbi:hypothetical protein [Ralstonia mannitolilytica]|uniref:Uncharacterized protein n=1 Tax=Ralstonia mannitolilytica TaxID=105219 RepID=A0AAD2AY02_9RALS|nr:hypothetical protein [Ralstonia mannitolilytica]MBY4721090.1 hypothetical protein [Ralstonia mannitolilytica]CAJ0693531.1 hypothetical protein R77591_04102 [Ralstonia mannitolilytica]CAJ0893015.1 hypothetical protein R77569_04275 [Ralstonia mannitolilytica]